jgi:hypothetical protein
VGRRSGAQQPAAGGASRRGYTRRAPLSARVWRGRRRVAHARACACPGVIRARVASASRGSKPAWERRHLSFQRELEIPQLAGSVRTWARSSAGSATATWRCVSFSGIGSNGLTRATWPRAVDACCSKAGTSRLPRTDDTPSWCPSRSRAPVEGSSRFAWKWAQLTRGPDERSFSGYPRKWASSSTRLLGFRRGHRHRSRREGPQRRRRAGRRTPPSRLWTPRRRSTSRRRRLRGGVSRCASSAARA